MSQRELLQNKRGEPNDASDHLVEIPLEVVLLHVNLLVGLDHVLQLFLSLLPLLELKMEKRRKKLLKKMWRKTFFLRLVSVSRAEPASSLDDDRQI